MPDDLTPDTVGYRLAEIGVSVRVTRTAGQSIPNSTTTAMVWDVETWDTDAMHSTVSNTSRLTCAVAGRYRVSATSTVVANATGVRGLTLWKNGAFYSYVRAANAGADIPNLVLTDLVSLVVGDYVEIAAFQNSGGALTFGTDGYFAMERIGA